MDFEKNRHKASGNISYLTLSLAPSSVHRIQLTRLPEAFPVIDGYGMLMMIIPNIIKSYSLHSKHEPFYFRRTFEWKFYENMRNGKYPETSNNLMSTFNG